MKNLSRNLHAPLSVSYTHLRQGNIFAVLIVGVYLVLASCCMFYMLSRVMKEKYEKEKLLYISNTDELTRCFNRHAYEERINNLDLREEWIYISMDLNNLKHTNAVSYTHLVSFLRSWWSKSEIVPVM